MVDESGRLVCLFYHSATIIRSVVQEIDQLGGGNARETDCEISIIRNTAARSGEFLLA